MPGIEILTEATENSRVRSLCAYLGSFDPFHRGHAWIVETLLEKFEMVLLLIPAIHFEKTVHFPLNATFEQRLKMLASSVLKYRKHNIAAGLAHEVLFIRLAECLARQFPDAEITFGMGNETFERFLDSKDYYKRVGLAWTNEEQAKLDELKEKIVVFGRSGNNNHFITVPEHVRWISSTLIRETVMELRKTYASEAMWQERLEEMISLEVLKFVLQEGLYTPVGNIRRY